MQSTQVETPSSFWSGMTRLVEGPLGWLVTIIVIPALLAAVLLLPPVNLITYLDALTYTRISQVGGAVGDPDGTMVNFPAEGIRSTFLASINSVPRADFMAGRAGSELMEAARSLPTHLLPRSPFYEINVSGTQPTQVVLSVPIPLLNENEKFETLGLYGWTGTTWEYLPATVLPVEEIIEARLSFVPDNFIVMQTAPVVPEVAAHLGLNSTMPEGVAVSSEYVGGLRLRGDGAIEPEGNGAPINNGRTVPVIRNWEGEPTAPTVRTDLVNNMLLDPGMQDNQIVAVHQTVVQNNYPGVLIDYRGVDALPSARADYVHLISELAARLHGDGKTLALRVESPRQLSAEEWDTGGYDWAALGRVVDTLVIPGPVDPMAYQPNGEMDAMMMWAVGQVDRRKIQVELSGQSVERSGNYLLLKGYQQALKPLLAQIETANGGGEVTLSLENDRLLSAVTLDPNIGMYFYTYQDDQGLERTVYIESAHSIKQKLQQLQQYNIRKVSLTVPAAGDVDPRIWEILLQFQQNQEMSESTGRLDVSYNIFDLAGNVIANAVRPLDSPTFAFQPSTEGELKIEATIISERGLALTSPAVNTIAIGDAVAASTTSAEGSVQAAAKASDEAGTVSAAAVPDYANLSAATIVNVRGGPGTVYSVLGQINPGTFYPITGKNEAGDWWEIDYNGQSGWIINELATTGGDLSAVALAANIPEPPAQPEVVAAEASSAAPVAVAAPPPSGGGSFGYGVQAHMVDTGGMENQVMSMTKGLGFGWVKQQVEWKRFEANQGAIDFGALDSIVNVANANGISLLFSVVNAPRWAREPGFDDSVGGPPQDPQTFANFNGAIAGKYCGSALKAIEVWNEQNLHYEWGNKPLNAGEYVALLAPSYAAIKGACPSMLVISGALTPAGSNPPFAIDDFTYFEEMFKAGVNNYADGFGAHPSGYNVPPSVTWEGACEAIQVSGNSFNGACDSPHHSWSFRSTMEGYRNIANVYGGGNKRIWPTEFGWAAGGAFDPRYRYADDNDFSEQAAWTVEAYQMMRNWGWAGPAFLWNLNFRVVANGTEKAQWGIVDPGWSPLPVYNALQSMPK